MSDWYDILFLTRCGLSPNLNKAFRTREREFVPQKSSVLR